MFFDTSKIINDLKIYRYSYVPSNDIQIKVSEINALLQLQESWDFLSRDPFMKTGDTYKRRGFCNFKANLNKKT